MTEAPGAAGGVVVVGASGHGREVADVVVASGQQVAGFVDDGEVDLARLDRLGLALLGPVGALASFGAPYVIGIGSGEVRGRVDREATDAGLVAASAVHPKAALGSDLRLGPGLVVCAHASITTNVVVGRHVHLNRGATVGHDCALGDHVTLHPGAVVSGDVTLGAGVTIGSGAVVLQGLTVGEGTIVGAGAVVTRDLPSDVVAYGSPARVVGAA